MGCQPQRGVGRVGRIWRDVRVALGVVDSDMRHRGTVHLRRIVDPKRAQTAPTEVLGHWSAADAGAVTRRRRSFGLSRDAKSP